MVNQVKIDEPTFKFRYFICLLSALVAFASTASRVTLTISLVAMISPATDTNLTVKTSSTPINSPSNSNLTTISKSYHHYQKKHIIQSKKLNTTVEGEKQSNSTDTSPYKVKLTESTNDRLLEIVFLGGLLSPIPVGRLGEIYGPKLIVTILLFINGMCMSLIPFFTTWSIYATACILFIKGASTSPLYSCASVLASHWCPKYQKTMFMCTVTGGSIISIITINPLVGYLCSLQLLGGWPLAFYLIGGFNFFVIAVWLLIVTNDPSDHPLITSSEKEFILRERTRIDEFNDHSVPYGKLIASGPIWALMLAHFSFYWFSALVAHQIPDYFKSILHVSIAEDGFLSGLPYVGAAASLAFFSYTVDKLRASGRFSTTAIRKIFADLGFILAPTFMIGSTLVGQNQWSVIACVCLAKAFATASNAGIMAVHLDLAPSYAGTLGGCIETIHNSAAMALNHAAYNLIGDQPTLHHWTNLFLLTAVISIIGTHYFALLGSSKIQPWDPTFKTEEKAIEEDQNGQMTYPTIFDPEIFIVDARSGSIIRKHSLAAAGFEVTTR